jgi:hypothetical protein
MVGINSDNSLFMDAILVENPNLGANNTTCHVLACLSAEERAEELQRDKAIRLWHRTDMQANEIDGAIGVYLSRVDDVVII